ncbi:MAG: Uma2 family endonuclease [Candidatus Rokuibacteriota bacterium]|nr:MAG: Uma2 family endonuclease [Candidatus Rokubacteria bacterium]
MAQAPLTVRRWTRREYERLVDLGAFEREPVELLGGHLIVAEPQESYHVTAVGMLGSRLASILPPGWIARVQAPLALDEESAPEPDLAVVRGTWADYRDAHPTSAALLVEVADSSLVFDRDQKGSLYARARVVDYWIVNLVDRLLEIYRDPGPDPAAPPGWRYRSRITLSPPAAVAPLALPAVRLSVGELLP